MQNDLKDQMMTQQFKKIKEAVKLIQNCGFDVKKLENFKYDKLQYEILETNDNSSAMKIKLEKYVKMKINELLNDENFQISLNKNTIHASNNTEEIYDIWKKIKKI